MSFDSCSSLLPDCQVRDSQALNSLAGAKTSTFATDDPAMVGTADIVIFAVKQYDTKAAAKLIVPLITNETAVISIQNGMDPHERLKTIVGREHVMGGTTYITGAKVMSPGIITHTGSIARLVFGEYDGSVSLRGERFLNTCKTSGIDARFLPISAKKCGKIRAAFRVQRSKQHVAQGRQTNNERS